MSVRPIGTVFTHTFPASETSNNPCPHRATYRVVAHVETVSGMAEQCDCLGIEELPAPELIPFHALESRHAYRSWQVEYANSVGNS